MTTSGSKGYLIGKIDAKGVRAHRVAWVFITGEWPRKGEEIDHINGVVTDNRASNLRVVSPRENSRNQRAYAKRSELPAGVNKNGKRYGARIQLSGQSIYLGSFDTPEEAGAAYLDAARNMGFTERHGQ